MAGKMLLLRKVNKANAGKIGIVICALVAVLISLAMMQEKVSANTYQTATKMDFSGQWTGFQYIDKDDELWYKLVIPSDGEYEMRIMDYSETYLNWTIKSEDLSNDYFHDLAESGTDSSPKTSVWNMAMKKGVYYLKLIPGLYCDAKIKMRNTFSSYNVNDSAANSYDSPQNYSFGNKITGQVGPTDEEDWFRINVPRKTRYILTATNYHEGYVDFEFFNSDLSEQIKKHTFEEGSLKSPKVEKVEITLPAGTCYLKVSDWCTFWGNKYDFFLTELNPSNCIHDYRYTTKYPTYFAKGYDLHKCSKCGKTYKSNYRAILKLDTPYIYSVSPRKKSAVVIWYGQDSDSSGYQIRYSKSKKMSGSKTITAKGRYTDHRTIKKLAAKKRYYFQVRAFKKSGNKTAYSKWSGKRSTKVK